MPKENINKIFDKENLEFLNFDIGDPEILLYCAIGQVKRIMNNETKMKKVNIPIVFVCKPTSNQCRGYTGLPHFIKKFHRRFWNFFIIMSLF